MMPMHSDTPLVESHALSKLAGCRVFLKMDILQPSGSFKIRGIGHYCTEMKKLGCTKLFSSSGGNAGLAASYAAKKLGLDLTVVVPTTTPNHMIDLLADFGASEVIVHGDSWSEAHGLAVSLQKTVPGSSLIHPFDHPLLWEGHSTIIDEILAQLKGTVPGCIVLSVGGGGLLMGILHALNKLNMPKIPIIAMETEGADCFNLSIKEGRPVVMDNFTSIATCLASNRISQALWNSYASGKYNIISRTVTDAEAVSSINRFVDDEKLLLQPACSVNPAAIYSNVLKSLQVAGRLPAVLENVVVVICGGRSMTLDRLLEWNKKFAL